MIKLVLLVFLSLAMCRLLFLPQQAGGFDLEAHEAISERAVDNTNLDSFLKAHFGAIGFPNGIAEIVNGKTVVEWIAQGSQHEDSPPLRVQEHFHNPLLPWNQACLGGLSSVIWAQERNQDDAVGGGNHSWHDARDSYFKALTSTTKEERDKAWAETFDSLGHVMHLIQDAASPAHTRGDPHICCILGLGDRDGFHTWAEREDNLPKISAMGSQSFGPSILGLSQDPLAPVPIARIMDTDEYSGANPGITAGTAIGITEYSNANFFSDDRLFSAFPFPSESSVQLGAPEPEPVNLELRRYFYKVADGDAGYRLAVPSALYESLNLALQDQEIGLDDKVFDDYAARLLPRAIGYAAGLIDYFFRGRIFAFTDDIGCFWPEAPPAFPSVEMVVANDSPIGEETGNGQVDFIVHYEVGGVKHYFPLVSQSVFLERDQVTRFMFSTAPLNAVPPNATNIFMIVTYRGPLGQETDAVIGGIGEISQAC